jgi:hypothetical protein
MRDRLKQAILKTLAKGQLTHSELCNTSDASFSTMSVALREMLSAQQLHKMRIGRNVYYALPNDTEPPSEKQINHTILTVLAQHDTLTLTELTKRCPEFNPDSVSKAVAKLIYTSKIFKHAKEKSKHIHYSTSNIVSGLLLVNTKRRKLDEQSDNTIGPFLREFLFNMPITL